MRALPVVERGPTGGSFLWEADHIEYECLERACSMKQIVHLPYRH